MMANYRDKIKKSNKSRYSGLLVAGSVMLNKNQKKKRERGKEKKETSSLFVSFRLISSFLDSPASLCN